MSVDGPCLDNPHLSLRALQPEIDPPQRADGSQAGSGPAIFVNGLTPPTQLIKGPPKLHHKKSRTGCQRCRARRVKCNEIHPECGNCQRHKLQCVYDRPCNSARRLSESVVSHRSIATYTAPSAPVISSGDTRDNILTAEDIPESKPRRLDELRLFHQYTSKTSQSLLGSPDKVMDEFWTVILPDMALSSDSLLYAMYSLSSLHLLSTTLPNPKIAALQPLYLSMALRQHKDEVDHIRHGNADAVCMTSMLLRVNAFVMLQERPLEPYTPPLDWLHMSSTAGTMLNVAWELVRDDPTSPVTRAIERTPMIQTREDVYSDANLHDLDHLLGCQESDDTTEPVEKEIQAAYKLTLAYIGSVQTATSSDEDPSDIVRRLVGFPFMIPKRFIDSVEKQQPRALIILAHYFALLQAFGHIWWIGETGRREIVAISMVLSSEWRNLMAKPLQVAKGETYAAADCPY